MKSRARKAPKSKAKGECANGEAALTMGIEGRRSRRAVAICVAIVVGVLVAVSLSSGSWAAAYREGNYVGRIWESMSAGRGFDSALEEVGAMVLSKNHVPEWLVREVLDEEWLAGSIAGNDQQVIWITRKGDLSEVRPQISSALESKGWTVVENASGVETVATYVKTEGECRWIIAEYVQSGKETIAVLRLQRN